MKTTITLLIIGSAIFIFFLLFSYLVHKDIFTQIDFDTTVRMQDNLPRRLDPLFSLFSDIGAFEVLTVILVVFLIFRRKMLAGLISISLFVLFHLIEIYGKFFVDHLPPPEFMLRTQRVVDFPQFHVRSEFSYPSGHSGRTIFLISLLLIYLWTNKNISIYFKSIFISVLLVFAVIMLVSRVYLGEHWLSDVIGGALLGGSLGIISASVSSLGTEKKFSGRK